MQFCQLKQEWTNNIRHRILQVLWNTLLLGPQQLHETWSRQEPLRTHECWEPGVQLPGTAKPELSAAPEQLRRPGPQQAPCPSPPSRTSISIPFLRGLLAWWLCFRWWDPGRASAEQWQRPHLFVSCTLLVRSAVRQHTWNMEEGSVSVKCSQSLAHLTRGA